MRTDFRSVTTREGDDFLARKYIAQFDGKVKKKK